MCLTYPAWRFDGNHIWSRSSNHQDLVPPLPKPHIRIPDKQFARKLLYCGSIIMAYSVVRVAVIAAQCVPLSIIWSPPGTVKGYCIKVEPALLVSASMNVLTDLIMFGLPIKKLWALRVDSRQRFQLMAIFLLGGLYVNL